MNTELVLLNNNISFGPLHDQLLKDVKLVGDELIFTYDIELYKDDFLNVEIYNNYKDFKFCDLSVKISDLDCSSVSLFTSLNKKNHFKGVEISIDEFCKLTKIANYIQYGYCYISSNAVKLELFCSFYDAKGKYKKYKKYSSMDMTLYAEKVSCKWYWLNIFFMVY